MPIRPLRERFNYFVMPEPMSGCWLWSGALNVSGYGKLSVINDKLSKSRKRTIRQGISAHRLSYEFYKGPIPKGLLIRHTCDNRCCVNPDHLILGTDADNIADCVRRGRNAFGTRQHKSKLNPLFVMVIREAISAKFTQKSIAEYFKICPATVSTIRHNQFWKHVS